MPPRAMNYIFLSEKQLRTEPNRMSPIVRLAFSTKCKTTRIAITLFAIKHSVDTMFPRQTKRCMRRIAIDYFYFWRNESNHLINDKCFISLPIDRKKPPKRPNWLGWRDEENNRLTFSLPMCISSHLRCSWEFTTDFGKLLKLSWHFN